MTKPNEPGADPEQSPAVPDATTLYIPNTSWPEPPRAEVPSTTRFDPMTGQPLATGPVLDGPIFDPMTGKRLVKRTRRPGVTALVVLAVVAFLCAVAGAVVVLVGDRDAEEKKDAAAARARACATELQPVYDALLVIDGRMTTGANIEAFSGLVGSASTALRQVDAAVVEERKCAMHESLSTLVAQYGTILRGWNDCLFEYDSCDTDTDIDVSAALSLVSVAFEMIEEADLGTDQEQMPLEVTDDDVAGMVEYL